MDHLSSDRGGTLAVDRRGRGRGRACCRAARGPGLRRRRRARDRRMRIEPGHAPRRPHGGAGRQVHLAPRRPARRDRDGETRITRLRPLGRHGGDDRGRALARDHRLRARRGPLHVFGRACVASSRPAARSTAPTRARSCVSSRGSSPVRTGSSSSSPATPRSQQPADEARHGAALAAWARSVETDDGHLPLGIEGAAAALDHLRAARSRARR